MSSPPTAADLRIGGLARHSTCDWPSQLVATVFCQGCSWRCRYCHNPALQPATTGTFAWVEVEAFLERRRGLLDGVVFSGGEPLLQAALPAAIDAVRALGLKVGLHTAGPSPERLEVILSGLDWVGFDAKAPFATYAPTTGLDAGAAARASLRLILAAGLPCEVRTTVHPALLSDEALEALGRDLLALGVRRWVLQAFRPTGCVDPALGPVPPPVPLPALLGQFESVTVR